MHKKILAFLTAFLLALPYTVFPAAAAEDAEASIKVISARSIDNYMHCYFQPNDPDMDITSVSIGAVAAEFQGGVMQNPKLIAGSDCAVRYMLLIDTSTSMPANSQKLLTFADALLEGEQQEAFVTIASFGDSFEIVKDNLSDPEEVRQAIEHLSYEQEVSDISGGVVEAITYLSTHAKTGEEICNLIVLTDGETYLSGTGSRRTEISQAADKAKETIKGTLEIVVHTVGFGQWESLTYQALSSGTGLDLSIRSNTGASEAGGQVAQFVDDLYFVHIPFTATQNVEFIDAQLMLTFDSPDDLEFIPLNHLRNASYVGADGMNALPGDGADGDAPDDAGEAPSGDAPETEDDVPENAGDVPDEDVSEGSGGTDEAAGAEDTADSDEDGLSDDGAGSDAGQPSGTPWAPIAAGAAVLVAAALLIGMLLGRNRKTKPLPAGRQEEGIWIRLELLSNNTVAGRLEYPIGDGLVIGSDPTCSVVFSDETVFSRNSRIYRRDGAVYIEDMNADSNTSVGGMKIHMPNRLRDGDEVTVGKVRFRVRFLNNDMISS